jgi:methyltransferase-like protein 6
MVNKQMLGEDLAESSQAILLEVGCGPGNMLYPVRGIARLEKQDTNRLLNSQVIQSNATIKAHCCDFSPRAIELIRVSVAQCYSTC